MRRPNLIGRENRLIYRRASDFGYDDASQAKIDSRSLVRQTEQQQQSNLDAQRAQQQQVNDLNAFEADRKAFADQNGTEYTPTNYSRTAGTANVGTGIAGTKLDAEGNPVVVYNDQNKVTMDRSLQNSMVGDRNGLGEIDQSALQRLMSNGMSYDEALRSIQGNRADVRQAFEQAGTGLSPSALSRQQDRFKSISEEANRRYPGNQEGANAYIKSVLDMDTAKANNEKANAPSTTPTAPTVPGATGAPTAPTTAPTPTIPGAETPTDPTAAGLGAAFANLPPEAQFLAPYLAQFQQSIQQSLSENASLTQGMLGQVEKTYGGIQGELDSMKQGYIDSTEAMNGLLDEVRQNNEETIAKQEKAAADKLAWDEYKLRSNIQKQKRDDHDAMVAQIALAGGFGQDAGIRAVMESDAEYESKLSDLAIQFSYARTDLAAKFTGLYNENQNNYINKTLENTKELRSALERIGMQGISNATARQQAEQGIITTAWNNQVNLRNTLATQNLNVAGQIAGMITNKRAEDRQVEQDSLEKIEYLLDNYPRETVADAIRELGKNVRSFNVETLINNPTKDEIEKARKAAGGGAGGGYGGPDNYLPTEMQGEVKPSVSFDEFTNKKIQEAESTQNRSLTPEAKAKLMFENAEKWEREYNDLYVAGATAQKVGKATTDLVQQFGQPTVDAATAVLNGTYAGTNPVKNAAKAFGVSEGAVATALTRLRQNGAVIETAILSPDQQTARNRIVNDIIKTDPFYTVWTGSKSAVTRIQTAIGDNGGADGLSDIMAINAFQNGIVDPGATVKEGDVALMQTAIAWSTKWGINTPEGREYWYGKIRKGDKLPAEMRQKMLQLATATRDAYGQDFQTETVPKILTRIRQDGLPESVLDDYIGQPAGVVPTVSSEVSSFANTYFSD